MVMKKTSSNSIILIKVVIFLLSLGLIMKDAKCDLYSDALGICNNPFSSITDKTISRNDFLKIDDNKAILEIGPYLNPLLRGSNVKYFDILDKEAIKNQILNEKNLAAKNYITSKADLTTVPDIAYVSPSGDMSLIKEKFDAVVSAHNIEHQIDLINHLNQVADLLNHNGKFYLIIPDKRYCFDHFIVASPLSDIISNHLQTPQKAHSLETILAMRCETSHNNSLKYWFGTNGEIIGINPKCYSEVIDIFNKHNGEYINAHRWRFTPKHFEFIINSLSELGLIKLRLETIYATSWGEQEFKAVLYKP
jgi:SAM-dependent methyltransferase